MIFYFKTKPKTNYPKCMPAKPQILTNKAGSHPCFCIQDIYTDLFIGNKAEGIPALISFSEAPHVKQSKEDLLKFLLPTELFDEIKRIPDKTDKQIPYVHGKDWEEYLIISTKNTKLQNVIFGVFSSEKKDSEKDFVFKVQQHFIQMLRPAEFSADLKGSLIKFVDEAIAPNRISKTANNTFHHLIEGDHEAIAKVIANIFISAMLGLYPINYDSSGNSRIKTYLLNNLGMEFVWTPEKISDSYIKLHDVSQPYEEGKFDITYEKGIEWLVRNHDKAPKSELAIVYLLLGKCLCLYPHLCDPGRLSIKLRSDIMAYFGWSHCSDENTSDKTANNKKAKFDDGMLFLQKSCKADESNADAFYTLYDLLKDTAAEDVKLHLKKAFDLNYVKAVIEVASLYLDGVCPFDGVTEESLLRKINDIIEHERKNDIVDVGTCLYLHGRFASIHKNKAKANEDFEASAKRGNERARQEIVRKKRNERTAFPSFVNDENASCCYANTLTGNNFTTISTFPNDTWVMYTPDKPAKTDINRVSGIEEFIKLQASAGFPHSRLVFFLMSEDEEKNLNECLLLLDKLFNIVLDKAKEERWRVIDTVDIFVSAKYETASMLIDANISDMGSDIYFKVHITDEDRDTVHKLLCEAPLFLPALKKGNNKTEVVLFGSSEMNYNFIKESIACAYMGSKHTITITLLGENAEILKNRLHQECPGIYNDNPHISCIRPEFIECSIKDSDFPSYIYGKLFDEVLSGKCEDSLAKEMVTTLRDANYFVVDYSDDLENIRFATELRTWLLRSNGTFKRAPFIGVKCSDEQNSYLASHLTLSGQASGNSYFNRYDLFPVGISAQTYSYENLINHPVLNDFALRIHKSYYGDKERAAENDFYSYSYNADSSLSTAIGLCYRFFAAGVLFNDKDRYLNFGFFKTPDIVTKFEDVYKEKLEDLAVLEQSRWNGFMLSRGWESANKSEVQAYKEQSTGWQHKHILAKKHPFIREWQDLDTPKLTELLDILKSKFDYDRQPQVTTRKSIEDTSKFFKVAEKTDEQTH